VCSAAARTARCAGGQWWQQTSGHRARSLNQVGPVGGGLFGGEGRQIEIGRRGRVQHGRLRWGSQSLRAPGKKPEQGGWG